MSDEQMDRILVTIRTAGAGHMAAAVTLADLPAFLDQHLATGKAVVAESDGVSQIIRLGREILDFFLGRRKKGGAKPKEEVTVLNPMRGGSDGPTTEATAQVIAVAMETRERGPYATAEPRQNDVSAGGFLLGNGRTAARGSRPMDPMAEMRAWQGLCDKEGEAAVMPLLHGGALAVRSTLWPAVVYLVKPETVLVLREGQVVSALCLQLADGGSIWDAVANRLSLLRAGGAGEIALWASANAMNR